MKNRYRRLIRTRALFMFQQLHKDMQTSISLQILIISKKQHN